MKSTFQALAMTLILASSVVGAGPIEGAGGFTAEITMWNDAGLLGSHYWTHTDAWAMHYEPPLGIWWEDEDPQYNEGPLSSQSHSHAAVGYSWQAADAYAEVPTASYSGGEISGWADAYCHTPPPENITQDADASASLTGLTTVASTSGNLAFTVHLHLENHEGINSNTKGSFALGFWQGNPDDPARVLMLSPRGPWSGVGPGPLSHLGCYLENASDQPFDYTTTWTVGLVQGQTYHWSLAGYTNVAPEPSSCALLIAGILVAVRRGTRRLP